MYGAKQRLALWRPFLIPWLNINISLHVSTFHIAYRAFVKLNFHIIALSWEKRGELGLNSTVQLFSVFIFLIFFSKRCACLCWHLDKTFEAARVDTKLSQCLKLNSFSPCWALLSWWDPCAMGQASEPDGSLDVFFPRSSVSVRNASEAGSMLPARADGKKAPRSIWYHW